eukprot:195811-Alexandrium_andersonii.AAC.1
MHHCLPNHAFMFRPPRAFPHGLPESLEIRESRPLDIATGVQARRSRALPGAGRKSRLDHLARSLQKLK